MGRYRPEVPLVTQAAMFLGAVPLGIARRALDEFRHHRRDEDARPGHAKHRPRHGCSVSTRASGREHWPPPGHCSLEPITGIWGTACRGDELSLEQRALALLAAAQAVRAAVDAVDRVFRLAGAEAVFGGNPLQRCFRDVHTIGQHILFHASREQAFAKVRAGATDQPTHLI